MARILTRMSQYLAVAVVGFVVGGIGLYVYWVRSGPPLELWHTAALTAEFTAEQADEVRTFDAYRQLEETLFAEAQQEVVAPTGAGPGLVLARYSMGMVRLKRVIGWVEARAAVHPRRRVGCGGGLAPLRRSCRARAGRGRLDAPRRRHGGPRAGAGGTWGRFRHARHPRRGRCGDDARPMR